MEALVAGAINGPAKSGHPSQPPGWEGCHHPERQTIHTGDFMIRYAVGDQVVILYGKHQSQKGRIIRTQEADVYEVRIEDGFILFFSGKGLEKDETHFAVGAGNTSSPSAIEAYSRLGDRVSLPSILSRKG